MRLLRRLGFVAYLVASACLLLLALEFAVRVSFPEINHQDTEQSLFAAPVPGQRLVHWRPNASGVSFGTPITIDAFGYRDLQQAANASDPSWLLLGDSVTFGVGVDAKDTFAGRLQAANPRVKVWNTAVVGYGIEDYLDVVKEFLAKRNPPSLIILFFCLNDAALRFQLVTSPASLPEKALGLLRRHSKLYMLMKGTLADRSRTYFLNDLAYYDAANPTFQRTVEVLGEIQTLLSRAGIPLLVVVLPYEYQLRRPDESYRIPQELLVKKLRDLGIPSVDLFEAFATSGRPGAELFLYGDAMHLSRAGHELVFRSLAPHIEKAGSTRSAAGPPPTR